MTDWRAILSRIQQQYSLSEIALVLGCDRMRLDNIKRGIEPKFEFGMRVLAVHDNAIGGQGIPNAISEAIGAIYEPMQHAKRRPKCGGSRSTSTTPSSAPGHLQNALSPEPHDMCCMTESDLSAPSTQAMTQ